MLVYASVKSRAGTDVRAHDDIMFRFCLLMVLLGAGFVLGLVGLGAKDEDGRRTFGRGIVGILGNGLILLIACTIFFTARKETLADHASMQKLRRSVSGFDQEMRNSYDSTNGIRVKPEVVDRYVMALNQSAREVSGDKRLVLQAHLAATMQLRAAANNFDTINQTMRSNVLTLLTLNQRAELDRRRTLVEQFLKANEALKYRVQNSDSILRDEVIKLNGDPVKLQRDLQDLQAPEQKVKPFVVSIRDLEAKRGQKYLSMLQLYEHNWGKWETGPVGTKPIISDAEFRDAYNQTLQELGAIHDEELSLQAKALDAGK